MFKYRTFSLRHVNRSSFTVSIHEIHTYTSFVRYFCISADKGSFRDHCASRDHANFACLVSLVTRAVSDARHRRFPSKIHFRHGRIAGLTMHGRCLERREAAQGKKETEEIGRVSRFFPSRATGHVPFDPGNPHLRSIDLLARSGRWSIGISRFPIIDPRGLQIRVMSRNRKKKQ